jgi:hypothetical protein
LPYDANIEIDEFRFMDLRDRPERDYREREPIARRPEPPMRNPLAEVVNNPAVTVTVAEVKAINDPDSMMTPQGEIVRRVQRAALYPPIKEKRTRKKTKTDRTMSTCLKMANARGKLKNGSFRKGWDQSRIMTYAHKLCRKEMGTKKGMVRKTARRAYEK